MESTLTTVLECFKQNVKERPDAEFIGWRVKQPTGELSSTFSWKTNAEINTMAERLAMSMIDGDYCPLVEGETEGEQLRFCGIWSKNRMEWSTTLLACMHVKVVPVGFYEAMSEDQIDFILN